MNEKYIGTCAICGRRMVNDTSITKHHLIPKCKNGKHTKKITIHAICHDKIHSVWSETELANYYNTVERIVADPVMKSFIKWVSKKSETFYVKTKMTNNRLR
jgi:hypothetical protein